MFSLLQMFSRQSLRSESGLSSPLYVFDFQSQQAFQSVSLSPVAREMSGRQGQKLDLEPIGDQSNLPKQIKGWYPSRVWSEWSDSDAPEEQTPIDSVQPANEQVKPDDALINMGFRLANGLYKRPVNTDTSKLAEFGYYVVEEDCCTGQGDEPTRLISAYNSENHYIGTPEDAKHLCEEVGIYPQLAKPSDNVCSVGKSRKDDKWYGWSHRALYGFAPGDSVKKGDCSFLPSCMEEACEKMREWYCDLYPEVKVFPVSEDDKNFTVFIQYYPNGVPEDTKCYPVDRAEHLPKGRGEYTIEDEAQCFQEACQFAQSVSSATIDLEHHVQGDGNLLSHSAKSFNPMDYAWYKFTGSRAKNYTDHNRSYDLSIDSGLVFGVRYNPRNKSVYVSLSDELLGQEWKLSEREAKLLLKNSKGFGGKRDGIKLTRGNGDFTQIDKKSTAVVTPGRPVKEEKVDKEVDKMRKKPQRESSVYLGFFTPSVNQPDRIAYVEGESAADVKRILDNYMSNQKALGSSGTIVKFSYSAVKNMLEKMGKKKINYIKSASFTSLVKTGTTVDRAYVPKGINIYDETIDVPQYNQSKFVPREPVFYGNEEAVLKELQEAIIRDKFFTAIFKNDTAKLKGNRIRRTPKGIPVIIFNSETVSRKFLTEAKEFVDRVKLVYGRTIKAEVSILGEKSANPKISVTMAMVLKPIPKKEEERKKRLLRIVRTTEQRTVNTAITERLIEDISKKDLHSPSELSRLERKLEKISNDSVDDMVITYNAPMYSIKTGQTFITVEVVRIDVARGLIYVQHVRNRKTSGVKTVESVYSLDGSKQLI